MHARTCTRALQAALQELREQLQGLRLRELKTRAVAEGISSETVDSADDSDDPKHFLIEAVLVKAQKPPPKAAAEKLRDELSTLKLSDLKRRARAEGVSSEVVDEADDSEDPKHFLIEAVLLASAEERKTPQATQSATLGKPHFGGATPTPARGSAAGRGAAAERRLLPRGKHVMLSYQCEFFATAATLHAVAGGHQPR